MNSKNWFEIDKNGLKALQEGKSKTFIIRELIQNAWDEKTKNCSISLLWNSGKVTITVEDDNQEGFLDLTDSFTLFKSTSKRTNPAQRGRFNFGEKQVLSICTSAVVKTTKGTVFFNKNGRKLITGKKTEIGSIISVELKMSKSEFNECFNYCKVLFCPKDIKTIITANDGVEQEIELIYSKPLKQFNIQLPTEVEIDGVFKNTKRHTNVHIHKVFPGQEALLYEMGIPICQIDCDYHIDVQQKVPLAYDRESVTPSYLKRLYGEVINNVFDDIDDKNSSSVWIRTGITSEIITKEAAKNIFEKRFGKNAVSANPFDVNSIDRAISAGFNVIHGHEMDSNEWNKFKKLGIVKSSSELFGSLNSSIDKTIPEKSWTGIQKSIANFSKKIAKKYLNIDVDIIYLRSQANVLADYKNKTIRFNLTKIPKNYFEKDKDMVCQSMLSLIVHEIAHEKGTHYETKYHETISYISSKMVYEMRDNKKWFKI